MSQAVNAMSGGVVSLSKLYFVQLGSKWKKNVITNHKKKTLQQPFFISVFKRTRY